MARNQNCDASRSTLDNSDAAPWSNLIHDALFLVMMQLGVFDFLAFSRVCKSWRSLALFNKKKFMASKPLMLIEFSDYARNDHCYLRDIEGRRTFKTDLPHLSKKDLCWINLWLHDLVWECNPRLLACESYNKAWTSFPNVHFLVDSKPEIGVRAILVFSPSVSRWVFAILSLVPRSKIWVSTVGNGVWHHVSSNLPFEDLHYFKGKIYAINSHFHLYELRLNPEPNLMLLETNSFQEGYSFTIRFARSQENLFLVNFIFHTVHELDFGKMNWVLREDAKEKYVFFFSCWELVAALSAFWAGFVSRWFGPCVAFKSDKVKFVEADMWYFPNLLMFL